MTGEGRLCHANSLHLMGECYTLRVKRLEVVPKLCNNMDGDVLESTFSSNLCFNNDSHQIMINGSLIT